jgi:hypothetical protein
MTMMTIAAAMALIATNRCVSPPVAPIIVGISQPESGLDPLAIHDNQTGHAYAPATAEEAERIASLLLSQHHDLDLGIAQVNVRNFGWTGLSLHTAFLPCASFAAGAKVLFAKYNGNPPDSVKFAYAARVTRQIAADVASRTPDGADAPPQPKQQVDPTDPQPPAWDMEAVADWNRRHFPTPEDAALAPAVSNPSSKEKQ